MTCVFTIGTYFEAAPLGWVLELNEHVKDQAAAKYGEPPYGHSAGADMTTKQIARQNDMAPADVYTLVRKIAANYSD